MLSDLFDFNCIILLLNETNTIFKFIPLGVPLFSFILISFKRQREKHIHPMKKATAKTNAHQVSLFKQMCS